MTKLINKDNTNIGTLFDYIDWRGDLSFDQDAFNKIDSLIFSELAYVNFDDLLKEKMTIAQMYDVYCRHHNIQEDLKELSFISQTVFILQKMAFAKRYKDLYLINYQDDIDLDLQKQFSALTIQINDNTFYIAYRGTDDTIVGWKEDFNMTYCLEVPSQKDAVDYLNHAYLTYKKETPLFTRLFNKPNFILGGHSKGGNLAIYSATKCNEEIQQYISYIDNFDGPGFHQELLKSDQYKNIEDKITCYLPTGSVFGMLLNHTAKTYYIETNINTMMQHSGLCWYIQGNDFVYSEQLDQENIELSVYLDNILNQMTYLQREEFVNEFFSILDQAHIEKISDITANLMTTMKTSVTKIAKMDENYRKIVFQLLGLMVVFNTDIHLPNFFVKKQ